MAHLNHNLVHAMIKGNELAESIISQVSGIVRYVKVNGLCEMFKPTLKSFCETRWNTVATMLKPIITHYDKISSLLLDRNAVHRLPQKNILIALHDFLENFADLTSEIEASKTVTAHLTWLCTDKINELLTKNRTDLELIKRMKDAGGKYFKQSCFEMDDKQIVAPLLHPLINDLSTFATENEKIRAKAILKNMVDSIPIINNSERENNCNRELAKRKVGAGSSLLNEYMNNINRNDDEIDAYLKETVEQENFNLLKWWYERRKKYPRLYKIFREIYSVPISSAPSERVFSCVGNIITDKRSNISAKRVEALLILYSNTDLIESCFM